MRMSGALFCVEMSERTISHVDRAAPRPYDAARMHSIQIVSFADHDH